MRRSSRWWQLSLALAFIVVLSCSGSGSLPGSELPDAESWVAENPQREDGVPLHIVVDMLVLDDFDGVKIEVSVDGELIVQGVGHARPEMHCNWYGPYVVVLDAGSHEIEAVTGDGLTLSDVIHLDTESHVIVMYQNSVDGQEGPGKPTGDIYPSTGRPGCL